MSKTYFITDVHGNYKGLKQSLSRSPYDPYIDTLIVGGDLVDGGAESAEVIEYLSELKYIQKANIILIKGNHDEWFKHWLIYGINPINWLQGQKHTAESYIKYLYNKTGERRTIVSKTGVGEGYMTTLNPADIPQSHIDFLNTGINYYIDDNNNCFVHGGFNRHLYIDEQDFDDIYYWDRDLWLQALSYGAITDPLAPLKFKMKDNFNKIFIGHTSTLNWGKTEPMFAANIVNCDTGAGHSGKVTIIDTESLEYWQSDLVKELYGDDFRR